MTLQVPFKMAPLAMIDVKFLALFLESFDFTSLTASNQKDSISGRVNVHQPFFDPYFLNYGLNILFFQQQPPIIRFIVSI